MGWRWQALLLWGVVVLGCGSDGSGAGDAGAPCTGPDQCGAGQVCLGSRCLAETCADNVISGNETDIDCGGSCLACAEGQQCQSATDCHSLYCDRAPAIAICRDCDDDRDCQDAPGSVCAQGLCRVLGAAGVACESATDCNSRFCVDGFCCETACDGECQSCAESLTGEGNGICAYTLPSAASCAAPSCIDGFVTASSSCDGAGTCVLPDPVLCAGAFGCADASTCGSSCTDDGGCAAGHWCDGGSCVLQLADGQSCTSSAQCSSGNCTDDGRCCGATCTGPCLGCNSAGVCGQRCDTEICCNGNFGCSTTCNIQ